MPSDKMIETNEQIKRYIGVLQDGCSIEIKRLSLCKMNPAYTTYHEDEYQVFCDDYRFQFCENYLDLYDAVDKFVELKNALYPRKK